jgi:hypothetical protein
MSYSAVLALMLLSVPAVTLRPPNAGRAPQGLDRWLLSALRYIRESSDAVPRRRGRGSGSTNAAS